MLMTTTTATMSPSLSHDAVIVAAQRAARAIPPLWPLASSVAVNPFLGQAGEPLQMAAARLRRASGIAVTMPRHWYAERLQS
ncbi:putative inorganic carbon transporter subunit DabA, partial [Xanthomonas phaseoli]